MTPEEFETKWCESAPDSMEEEEGEEYIRDLETIVTTPHAEILKVIRELEQQHHDCEYDCCAPLWKKLREMLKEKV